MNNKRENKNNSEESKKNSYNVSPEQEKLLKIAKELKSKNSTYYFHGSSGGKDPSPPPCCSEDMDILTINGKKLISEVRIGDIVLTESNKPEVIIMVNKIPVLNHKVLKITFNDDTVLKVSPKHPTSDERLFSDLKIGEVLSNKKIVSIDLLPYEYKYTYDILPDSLTGNYFANGILIGSTLKQFLLERQIRTA